jgi:hypothetical protein
MGVKKADLGSLGCLVVFALPFAAVGVVMAYFSVYQVATWYEMRGWTAVAATILDTDLEAQRRSRRAQTQEATATYRYRYAGTDYEGSRVAISDISDNLGSFHEDLYRTLRGAQRRGATVPAYVDPQDPASATLNRQLRWPLLLFTGMFALIFGTVGFGLLIGAALGAASAKTQRTLQDRHPREPWRWQDLVHRPAARRWRP